MPPFKAAIILSTALVFWAGPARADLTVCNTADTRLSAAIGYNDGRQWISEGWWQIGARGCTKLLSGNLPARFYYLHVIDYDEGRSWGGPAILCTARTAFTIEGRTGCGKRGYRRTGFHEVDTGDAVEWTVTIPPAALTRRPSTAPDRGRQDR